MSESASLTVTGMKCGGCEGNVCQKVQALDGVIAVTASSKDNRVEVEFDPAVISLDDIADVIFEAGFKVEDE